MNEEMRKAIEIALKDLDDGFGVEIESGSQFHYWLQGALAQPATVQGWRPIETAPRGSGEDGPGNVTHPDYIAPPTILLATQEGLVVGYYDWYYHEGYGHGAEPGVSAWRTSDGGQAYEPTHWQPLPQPPEAAQASATEMDHRSRVESAQTERQGKEGGSAAVAADALREFADEADATVQMVIRTFGDRDNPPKLLDAFATITMCKKLAEQYAAMSTHPAGD